MDARTLLEAERKRHELDALAGSVAAASKVTPDGIAVWSVPRGKFHESFETIEEAIAYLKGIVAILEGNADG
jgi:hypothetical protein